MSQEPETYPIYPSFGQMAYWHLATDIQGTLDDRAKALLAIVRTGSANVQKWPLAPIQVRAMALELAAAHALHGRPFGADLLRLLVWSMDLPKEFLSDPSDILSGSDGKGQGADPQLKSAAELADWLYFQSHGQHMSINALSKEAGRLAGCTPPSRSTVRAWVKGWRGDLAEID